MVVRNKAKIIGVSKYLPPKVVTNEDMAKEVETSDEWIFTRTGIRSRRIAGKEVPTSTLGIEAAKLLFEKVKVAKEDVGLVIFATMTPDFPSPATASILQEALSLPKAGAYDMQVACSGFVYAIAQAKAFVEAGLYKNVLVVAAEKMSSVVDFTDRKTCILFGDGASAALICSEWDRPSLAISSIELGSDGKGASFLDVPAGGSKNPTSLTTLENKGHFIRMEGAEVFKHAVRRMAEAVNVVLTKEGLSMDDVKFIVPHQANRRIIDALAKHFSLPIERFFLNLENYANTSGASVGIALSELFEKESLKPGEKIVLTAFGAGFAWGAAVLEQIDGDKR